MDRLGIAVFETPLFPFVVCRFMGWAWDGLMGDMGWGSRTELVGLGLDRDGVDGKPVEASGSKCDEHPPAPL